MESWECLIPELIQAFPELNHREDYIKDLLKAGSQLPASNSKIDKTIARFQRNTAKYHDALANIEALKRCPDLRDWKAMVDFLNRDGKTRKVKTGSYSSPVIQTDIQLPEIHDHQPSPSSNSSEKENENFATNALFNCPSRSNQIDSVVKRKMVHFRSEIQKISPQRDPTLETSFKDVIRQLIAALQGIPSNFFEVDHSGTAFHPSQCLEQNLDKCLLERLGKLLTPCLYVLALQRMRICKSNDLIWQVFAFSLDKKFSEYLDSVSELYNKVLRVPSSVDLSDLDIFESSWITRLRCMGDLAAAAEYVSGMEILNYVYIKSSTEADSKWNKILFEYIIQEMSITFHELLIKWLIHGELNENIQWFIEYDEISTEIRRWKRFVLVSDEKIPVFLRNSPDLLEKILSIGRTVHFIMQARETSSYDENLHERSKLVSSLDPKRIYYNLTEQNLLREALEKLHDIVIIDLMNDLRNLNHLGDHLMSIQLHFLLTHYLFSATIVPGIKRAMQSRIKIYNRTENTPANIANAAVKFAIKVSKSMLGLQIGPNFISGTVRESDRQLQEVADFNKALYLIYNAPGSVFMILSDSVLKKYSEIFRKLHPIRQTGLKFDESYLKLKTISKQIFAHSKDLMPILRCFHFAYFFLGQFIKKVQYFVYHDVIPTYSKKLEKAIENAKSIERIEAEHTRFIDSIIDALFLKPSQKNIREVFKTCIKYVDDLSSLLEEFIDTWNNEMKRRTTHMSYEEARTYSSRRVTEEITDDEQAERENAVSLMYTMNKPYIVNLIIDFQNTLRNMVYLMEANESLHGNHLFLQLQLLCTRCLNHV